MAAFPELGLLRSQDGFPQAGKPSFPGGLFRSSCGNMSSSAFPDGCGAGVKRVICSTFGFPHSAGFMLRIPSSRANRFPGPLPRPAGKVFYF